MNSVTIDADDAWAKFIQQYRFGDEDEDYTAQAAADRAALGDDRLLTVIADANRSHTRDFEAYFDSHFPADLAGDAYSYALTATAKAVPSADYMRLPVEYAIDHNLDREIACRLIQGCMMDYGATEEAVTERGDSWSSAQDIWDDVLARRAADADQRRRESEYVQHIAGLTNERFAKELVQKCRDVKRETPQWTTAAEQEHYAVLSLVRIALDNALDEETVSHILAGNFSGTDAAELWRGEVAEREKAAAEEEFIRTHADNAPKSFVKELFHELRYANMPPADQPAGWEKAALERLVCKAQAKQLDRDGICRLLDDFVWGAEVDVFAAWDHETAVRAAVQQRNIQAEVERRYNANQIDALNTRFVNGADFIRAHEGPPPALWGARYDVLWAKGEALTMTSGPGVGKTTMAGQLVRCQLFGGELLGYPVARLADVHPDAQRILYLAVDRPEQIGRSLARQFSADQLDQLDEQLTIWNGPLPADAAARPGVLVDMAKHANASVVYVDSLKDMFLGVAEDRAAAAYQLARNTLIGSGRQLCELHHLNKRGDDYGSIWLNAGAGSVLKIAGKPGCVTATLTHEKQPANQIGPLTLTFDRPAGTVMAAPKTSRQSATEGPPVAAVDGDTGGASEAGSVAGLGAWVESRGAAGVTASETAVWLHGSDGRNHRARAQRALETLCGDGGRLRRVPGQRGRGAARWVVRDDL